MPQRVRAQARLRQSYEQFEQPPRRHLERGVGLERLARARHRPCSTPRSPTLRRWKFAIMSRTNDHARSAPQHSAGGTYSQRPSSAAVVTERVGRGGVRRPSSTRTAARRLPLGVRRDRPPDLLELVLEQRVLQRAGTFVVTEPPCDPDSLEDARHALGATGHAPARFQAVQEPAEPPMRNRASPLRTFGAGAAQISPSSRVSGRAAGTPATTSACAAVLESGPRNFERRPRGPARSALERQFMPAANGRNPRQRRRSQASPSRRCSGACRGFRRS